MDYLVKIVHELVYQKTYWPIREGYIEQKNMCFLIQKYRESRWEGHSDQNVLTNLSHQKSVRFEIGLSHQLLLNNFNVKW